MSEHKVEVVPVVLEAHPNADSLSVVRVYGYTCCVRTADWQTGDLAAFIPPDSVVDTSRQEFAFLGKHSRIAAKRLRGVQSFGLLVHAPAGMAIGEDAAQILGVTHYEPQIQCVTGGEAIKPPAGYHPIYDVESARRYAAIFRPGEVVQVTEKIHGANARFCFDGEQMHCGSRAEWKRKNDDDRRQVLWWSALANNPSVEAFCRAHPDITVYGEVYGQVQDLKYGVAKGMPPRVAVFDLLRGNEWINANEARDLARNLPWVPIIAECEWDFAAVAVLADGRTLIPGADNIREGCVVRPWIERTCLEIGRVIGKFVSVNYLERK